MSPSHVLEPTYNAIKHRLLVGHWAPGFRLEAARLAADIGVSITPIRDSLNHLAGERLVELMPGEGFRVPTLNAADLRDLLNLNQLLLLAAIEESDVPITGSADAIAMPDLASATASLFLTIASASGNGEITMMVQSLNDRLHPFRQLDDAVLADAASELETLRACFASGTSRSSARDLLLRYHHVRKFEADRYIKLLARGRS